MKFRTQLKDIGNAAEITALVKRLERRGMVGRTAPLTEEEIERQLNRIRNEGRKDWPGGAK